MIKALWFVRHGQSVANANGVYGGARHDIALTPIGREQAVAAGELLLDAKINIIISSNLDRAQQTAHIIARTINYDESKIILDQDWHEINTGKLTGRPDMGFESFLHYLSTGEDSGAETIETVTWRVKRALERIISSEEYDGKTILLVAHAGVARVLETVLTGKSINEIAPTNVANASPYLLPLNALSFGDNK